MKSRFLLFNVAVFILMVCSEAVFAQSLLPPVPLKGEDFITSDGVQLHGTYYPSTLGKEAVPVMIVQDLDESRKSLHPLALALQEQGCAVVTLDVRGQGDSNKRVKKINGGRDIKEEKFDKPRLNKIVIQQMVTKDIDMFKRFLNRQNDEGTLNVQKLCLVGIGPSGSFLATAYATFDYSWGSQGSDVRALALGSPAVKSNIMSFREAMPNKSLQMLPVYIWYGAEDVKAAKDADTVVKMFKMQRPGDEKKPVVDRTLFEVKVPTSLQGLKLVTAENSVVERHLKKFIEIKLQKKDFPAWSSKQ